MVFFFCLLFHRIGRETTRVQLGKVESCHAIPTWIDVHEVAPALKEYCYWALLHGPTSRPRI